MDDIELTDDEHLRALAALEAVVGNNDTGLAVLAAGSAAEKPLPELLAAYGKHTLERILVAAFGITSETGHGEMGPRLAELNADPQARLTFLLAEALRQQAVLAGDDLAHRDVGAGGGPRVHRCRRLRRPDPAARSAQRGPARRLTRRAGRSPVSLPLRRGSCRGPFRDHCHASYRPLQHQLGRLCRSGRK